MESSCSFRLKVRWKIPTSKYSNLNQSSHLPLMDKYFSSTEEVHLVRKRKCLIDKENGKLNFIK